MLTVIRRLTRSECVIRKKGLYRCISTAQTKTSKKEVEEIKVPVPWGYIAGKWWGDKNTPPVIAVHGWQDNANTFDRLIPLLNIPSVLSIDLPGHGLSSHLPEGKVYDFEEHITLLHRIRKHFNWDAIPLLGHSFGGALTFAYASVFPDKVKYLINIECGRTLLTLFRMNIQDSLSRGIDAYLAIEKQKKESQPPVYKLSTMVKMCIEGSLGSISTTEAAMILLKRAISPADKNADFKDKTFKVKTDLENFIKYEKVKTMSLPAKERESLANKYLSLLESFNKVKEEIKDFKLNEDEDKYYTFRRDPVIKVGIFQSFDDEFLIEASRNIRCPVLSLRAKNGFLFFSTKKLYEDTLNIVKENCYVEHHEVDGTHHAHLIVPEPMAPIINNFYNKISSNSVKVSNENCKYL